MKKYLLSVIFALFSFAAFAGGLWDTLPTTTTVTGAETVPADTNLPGGQMPQDYKISVSQLRGALMQQSTPLTGFSITAATGTNIIQITPAGTLATGTVVFPASVVDGHRLRIFSTQTVTTLTLTPGAGQTINAGATTIAANTALEYVYQASNATWYRVN